MYGQGNGLIEALSRETYNDAQWTTLIMTNSTYIMQDDIRPINPRWTYKEKDHGELVKKS